MSAMTRSNVDLPQPEGPSSVRKPPSANVSETFSSAVTDPRSLENRTVTSRHSIAVPARVSLISTDLGTRVGGGLEDVERHHFIDRGRAFAELTKLAVKRNLILPDR